MPINSISLTINQQVVTAAPGTSILEAATAAGIVIPTLCFNKSLEETGACWMCIVEIKGKNRFVPACDTPVSDGMVIETENDTLSSMRRQSLERIIQEHSGDCLGPCEITCPAGCDIPGFVAAIASHDDARAIAIIKQTIPLPGILGRVCPAPCEDECRRHGVDQPVSICALKRYAADKDAERAESYTPECVPTTGKKVAIVGSGPAGLTAAWFLLCNGHEVTIIEASAQAGGMMRYGIPRFRLPESVIESDIATLISLGVTFQFNTTFGKDVTLEALRSACDAVFLAIGAQKAAPMNIPGENEAGVISGIEFLRKAASGDQLHAGNKVVVAGGGNTAIDAARTAIRLGASTVTLLYRRSREEMPANASEIEEALAEGITLVEWAAPIAIRRLNGVLEITAITMQPGALDASGRRTPVPVEGSEFTIRADTIISAIGQQIDHSVAHAAGTGAGKYGELLVDPETLQSETVWLFAGGDCVTGTDTAIRAVEQGKRAAYA
ncbi:MAG: FAD-dependent oxidoreductase, partial [Chlorobium sp.]